MGWAELREQDHTPLLATAEDYGGPLRACVAMMMLRTGASLGRRYPDVQHVQSFARHNPQRRGDLDTALGAVASFGDRGQSVRFIGRPVRRPRTVSRRDITSWQELLAGRATADIDYRSPRSEDLTALLSEPEENWIIKLDVPGDAVGQPDLRFQPCLLVAEQGGMLTVHNPGNTDLKAEAYQEIPTEAALCQNAVAARHASIMAVRPVHFGS